MKENIIGNDSPYYENLRIPIQRETIDAEFNSGKQIKSPHKILGEQLGTIRQS